MTEVVVQRKLAQAQVSEFYHDLFVDTQVKHFESLCMPLPVPGRDHVVDIGGGCGFFASAVTEQVGPPTRVIDMDAASIEQCRQKGIEAILGDALKPPVSGDEAVVCFNLILHHLVGATEAATQQLQGGALGVWSDKPARVFINEYIYDSYVGNLSGRLIYEITSSRVLSYLGNLVAKIVPSLKANTFGVGVRFRSTEEWVDFFERRGWSVVGHIRGEEEIVSPARRCLLIKSCRRDSFVLQAAQSSKAEHPFELE